MTDGGRDFGAWRDHLVITFRDTGTEEAYVMGPDGIQIELLTQPLRWMSEDQPLGV